MTSTKRSTRAGQTAMESDDFARLVAEAQSGDQDAFGKIIAIAQNRLFRFCLFLCGDRALAEDISQEALLRAYSRLGSLTKTESFMDWLFRIAKNLYIDHVRSAHNRETDLDPEALESAFAEGSDVAQILAVQKILAQFEPEDRALLILIEIEERSYKEAAELLEISEDAVRSRLFRLRQSFLEKWRQH